MAVFFADSSQKFFSMYIIMPAAAGEIFFEITSQDLPKMALLSSFFIEKSILEDYARRPWQFFSCLTAKYTPKLPVFGAAFH